MLYEFSAIIASMVPCWDDLGRMWWPSHCIETKEVQSYAG